MDSQATIADLWHCNRFRGSAAGYPELQSRAARGQSRAGRARRAQQPGWTAEIGILKAGHYEGIVAARGNPLEDISALEHVAFVMRGGVIFRSRGSTEAPP